MIAAVTLNKFQLSKIDIFALNDLHMYLFTYSMCCTEREYFFFEFTFLLKSMKSTDQLITIDRCYLIDDICSHFWSENAINHIFFLSLLDKHHRMMMFISPHPPIQIHSPSTSASPTFLLPIPLKFFDGLCTEFIGALVVRVCGRCYDSKVVNLLLHTTTLNHQLVFIFRLLLLLTHPHIASSPSPSRLSSAASLGHRIPKEMPEFEQRQGCDGSNPTPTFHSSPPPSSLTQ